MTVSKTESILPSAFVDQRLVGQSITLHCEGPHVFVGTLVTVESPGQEDAAVLLRYDTLWYIRIPVYRIVAVGYPGD